MRRILTTIASVIAAFGLVVAAFGLVAHGQSAGIRANIPFDFWVGNTPMHAGDYTLGPTSVDPAVVLMRDDNGASSGFLTTIRLDEASGSALKLVFHRYGDEYFLSEIWNGSYKLGLRKSEKERERMASHAVPAEVLIAGN